MSRHLSTDSPRLTTQVARTFDREFGNTEANSLHLKKFWKEMKNSTERARILNDLEKLNRLMVSTGGPYKKHFLTQFFGTVSYRGPHRFFPKNGLYIGVIFKVAKI